MSVEVRAHGDRHLANPEVQWVLNQRARDQSIRDDMRLRRFMIMETAGQPRPDIKPEEQKMLDSCTDFQKKKLIIENSRALQYLDPFYENTWNHKTQMSNRSLKSYVADKLTQYSPLYIKNEEKEILRRKKILQDQAYANTEKLVNINTISRLGGSHAASKLLTSGYKSQSQAALSSLRFSELDPHAMGQSVDSVGSEAQANAPIPRIELDLPSPDKYTPGNAKFTKLPDKISTSGSPKKQNLPKCKY